MLFSPLEHSRSGTISHIFSGRNSTALEAQIRTRMKEHESIHHSTLSLDLDALFKIRRKSHTLTGPMEVDYFVPPKGRQTEQSRTHGRMPSLQAKKSVAPKGIPSPRRGLKASTPLSGPSRKTRDSQADDSSTSEDSSSDSDSDSDDSHNLAVGARDTTSASSHGTKKTVSAGLATSNPTLTSKAANRNSNPNVRSLPAQLPTPNRNFEEDEEVDQLDDVRIQEVRPSTSNSVSTSRQSLPAWAQSSQTEDIKPDVEALGRATGAASSSRRSLPDQVQAFHSSPGLATEPSPVQPGFHGGRSSFSMPRGAASSTSQNPSTRPSIPSNQNIDSNLFQQQPPRRVSLAVGERASFACLTFMFSPRHFFLALPSFTGSGILVSRCGSQGECLLFTIKVSKGYVLTSKPLVLLFSPSSISQSASREKQSMLFLKISRSWISESQSCRDRM